MADRVRRLADSKGMRREPVEEPEPEPEPEPKKEPVKAAAKPTEPARARRGGTCAGRRPRPSPRPCARGAAPCRALDRRHPRTRRSSRNVPRHASCAPRGGIPRRPRAGGARARAPAAPRRRRPPRRRHRRRPPSRPRRADAALADRQAHPASARPASPPAAPGGSGRSFAPGGGGPRPGSGGPRGWWSGPVGSSGGPRRRRSRWRLRRRAPVAVRPAVVVPAVVPAAWWPRRSVRGGRGRPGGPRPRRKKRRRRNLEELGPQAAPTLTPLDAPVPEGEIVVPRGITIQELAPKLNRTTGRPRAHPVRRGRDGHRHAVARRRDDRAHRRDARRRGPARRARPGGTSSSCRRCSATTRRRRTRRCSCRAPPVVTVMGHVDHGKTTLLDRIRDGERRRGRGRRHHAAHRCVPGRARTARRSRSSTRPGHEAFTAMRARGAQATDIAVLVVAADDGVMPQTVEAISHARAADVPIVVAITKVDREDANPDRVRQQLVEQRARPRGVGRRHDRASTSRRPRASGVDELLEAILLVADGRGAGDEPRRSGSRVRARVEPRLRSWPGRRPRSSSAARCGVGEPVVAGGGWGRVRAMFDDHGAAGAGSRPVHAGRGARPRRRAARGRRAAGRARRQDRPHRGRGPRPATPRGEPRRTRWRSPAVPASRTSSRWSSAARSPRSTSC